MVEPGSTFYTDEWTGYTGMESDYAHKTVNHAVEYVSGRVHINGVENLWPLLKRGLKGRPESRRTLFRVLVTFAVPGLLLDLGLPDLEKVPCQVLVRWAAHAPGKSCHRII